MGPFGYFCVIIWGLLYLPDLTGFLLMLAFAFFMVVLLLDQFGLLPKTVKRPSSQGIGRIPRFGPPDR
jgi:hypothetical protein